MDSNPLIYLSYLHPLLCEATNRNFNRKENIMHQPYEKPIARAMTDMPLGFMTINGFCLMRYPFNFELDLMNAQTNSLDEVKSIIEEGGVR